MSLIKFKETVPPLKITIDIEPMAHKETRPDRRGFMRTDPSKRDYMITVANMLRDYKGWFKGVRYLSAKFVFYVARPTVRPDNGIPGEIWRAMDFELYKNSRPDSDNYEKSLQDCLSNHIIRKASKRADGSIDRRLEVKGAGIIDDDSIIVSKLTKKLYAKRGQKPRIDITLRECSYIYKEG